MPEALKELGNTAFSNCKSLKEISIPSNITDISYQCFSGCTSLEKASLPDTLKSISDFSFSNCTALKEIKLPDTLEIIYGHAFSGCTSLEKIELPDNAKIGSYAFLNCTSLSDVRLPQNKDIKLSNQIFENTPWLDAIRKENDLIIINNQVFDGKMCKGDLVIPEGVTAICEYAFKDSKITSVKLPESLKTIGYAAFNSCKNLEEFTIPDGIEVIPGSMFSGCTKLKAVNIPDSVTKIENNAFGFCYGFTDFIVPATVKFVDMAFEYADNLKTITFLNPDCIICGDSENFSMMPHNTTVRGYADSTAYWYAYYTKRNFELISESGDANCDGELSMADAVLIMQSISNPDKYGEKGTDEHHITEQGKKNADITGENDGITNADALAIQKKLLKLD